VFIFKEHIPAVELVSIYVKKASVPIISDSASVGNFGNQKTNSIPGWFFLGRKVISCASATLCSWGPGAHACLSWVESLINGSGIINVHLKYVVSSLPVRVIEIINDIPAKVLKAFSLNNDSMEPCK